MTSHLFVVWSFDAEEANFGAVPVLGPLADPDEVRDFATVGGE